MLRFLAAILVPAVIFLSFQAGAQSEGTVKTAPTGPPAEAGPGPMPPAGEAGRYEMRDAEGGVLRLDTQSGVVSFCHRLDGAWRCEGVGDEVVACEQRAAAIEAKLELAQRQLDALRQKLADAESSGISMPDREDFESALTYLQGMMHSFMDKVRSLTGEEEQAKRI